MGSVFSSSPVRQLHLCVLTIHVLPYRGPQAKFCCIKHSESKRSISEIYTIQLMSSPNQIHIYNISFSTFFCESLIWSLYILLLLFPRGFPKSSGTCKWNCLWEYVCVSVCVCSFLESVTKLLTMLKIKEIFWRRENKAWRWALYMWC